MIIDDKNMMESDIHACEPKSAVRTERDTPAPCFHCRDNVARHFAASKHNHGLNDLNPVDCPSVRNNPQNLEVPFSQVS